jgi:hypothetical protein
VALKKLIEWGVLKKKNGTTGPKGGRPAEGYAVNPGVFPEK